MPTWVVKGSGKGGWLGWEGSDGSITRGKRITSMGGGIPKHLQSDEEGECGLGSNVLIDMLKGVVFGWRRG